MDDAIELTDSYTDDPQRKVYTFKEMGIPGLSVLGKHLSGSAVNPLVRHYHRSRIEIRLLTRGNNVICADGKRHHLKKGDVFIIPADMPHDTGSSSLMGPCEMYWFQLLVDKPPFLFLEEHWAAELQQQLGNLQAGLLKNVDFSRKYLVEMFSLLTSSSCTDKHHGISQLVAILYRIISCVSPAAAVHTQQLYPPPPDSFPTV